MQIDSKQMWDDCLKVIKDIVPQATYDVWFKPIIPLSYEDQKFTIQVPTQFFYEYLEDNYVNILKMTLDRVCGEGTKLNYRVMVSKPTKLNGEGAITYPGVAPKQTPQGQRTPVDSKKAPGPFVPPVQDLDSQLNPNYTFDNFFESESNRLVYAVSEKIALNPGETAFNPLFIYGPSGVGKTHICYATGLKIRELYPQKRVLYVTANTFRHQFTDAVLKNETNDFLSFYQSIDVLLLDDIHELIGRTKTQEIFFQIFNNLHQLRKQLILTCDRAPVDLQGMEERLISRLKWGMTAQIERPNLDLRKKIMRHLITKNGLEITEEVFEYIAEHVTENVRDLEGILVSLMANSIITNKEIDIQLTRQVISQTIRIEKKQLTINKILETVCRYFNMDQALIQTKSRKQEIVQTRQISMFLAKKYTDLSFACIGKIIGGKDHATVMHSCNTVRDQIEISKSFRATMEAIESCLKQ